MRLPIYRALASLLIVSSPACAPAQSGEAGPAPGASADCPRSPSALSVEHPSVYLPCQVDQPWRVDTLGRPPRHPEMLKSGGIGGFARVPVVIDTGGRARAVGISTSSHQLFAVAVRNAFSSWSFQPARLRGRKVAVLDTVEVRFPTPEPFEIVPGCTHCDPTESALRFHVERAAERHAQCGRALSALARRPKVDSLAWWAVEQLRGCERATDAAALAIRLAANAPYADPAAAMPAFVAGERVRGEAVLDAAEAVALGARSAAARVEAFALLTRVIAGYARHAGAHASWDSKRKRPAHGCGTLQVSVESVPLPPGLAGAALRARVEQTARATMEASTTPAAVRVAAFCAGEVLRESAS